MSLPFVPRTALLLSAGMVCASFGHAATPNPAIRSMGAGRVTVSWPVTSPRATLEASAFLGQGVAWEGVASPVTEEGGTLSVVLEASGQARFYRLRAVDSAAPRILETSPVDGTTGVAVTRETIFRFDAPLAPEVQLGADDLFAEVSGIRLLARTALSADRRTATLFFLENLPSAARVRVTLNGDDLRSGSGLALDADSDGLPGGTRVLDFDTFGATGLPNTAVVGKVFASEKNPDGSNRPLAGVTVTVDGAEETLRATTDAAGVFQLMPSPAGRFFVHVDGRTAVGSHWPGGAYYPFVGKAWEAVAGRTNNLAGGSGEVFLPLIQADALTAVSTTDPTRVGMAPSVLAVQPELAGVEIEVPANSLFSDNGARGGKVGLALVAPDRLPEPLPPGLNLPMVITIQTDGGANFDRPASVKFPNLPDPVTGVKLAPGAKTALWSFNHDTGRWEVQGSMTISADGLFAVSDPGVGVRQPGWHGPAPGTGGGGPRRRQPDPGPPPPPPDPPEPCFDACGILAKNFTACWDGYYERYMKTKAPTDPDELRAWEEDRAEKFGECDDKLKDLMECREDAGGPCSGAVLFSSSTASQNPASRRLAAPARSLEAILADATELTELEQSFEDERILWPGPGDYFLVAPFFSGESQRGRLNDRGRFDSLILSPDEPYLVSYLSPDTGEVGLAIFRSAANGQITLIPGALLNPSGEGAFVDRDGDGLVDVAENVVGTDPLNPDSDADGASDGLEIRAGTHPLDGVVVQPGVLASVPSASDAMAVEVENGIAAVLEVNRSIALFDVSDPARPVFTGRVSVPGIPVAIALKWPLLAVAQAGGNTLDFRGVTLVEVSNPTAPIVRWSKSLSDISMVGVALGYGRVYVSATSGGLNVLTQSDGSLLGTATFGGHELRIVGNRLDALTAAGPLVSRLTTARITMAEILPQALGEVTIPGAAASGLDPTRLHSESEVVFVGTGSGYRVVDVRNPETPILFPGAAFVAGRIHDLSKDTSPLLLATTSFSGPTTLQVSFFDSSNLAVNTNRTLILETPGDPTGIRLYRGHAYIADRAGGLVVLNYRLPDLGTNPPTVTLRAFPTEASPARHEGGSPLHLSVLAQDDVVVRDVEFYLGDQRYVTVGNTPFETDLPTPIWRRNRSEVVVRARATDTAGNVTWSAPLTVPLIPDITPPRVSATAPADGFVLKEGVPLTLAIQFSEPMNRATLKASGFVLVAAGSDGVLGTADDQPVADIAPTVGSDDASVALPLPSGLTLGQHRVVVRGSVADSNDIPMGADFAWNFEVRAPIRWNVAAAGAWSGTANWSPARLPGTNDFVTLDRPEGDYLVTLDIDNGTQPPGISVQALVAHEPVRFEGAPGQSQVLAVAQGAEFFRPVTFARTVFLNGGPWNFAGGITILPQRIVELGNLAGTYGPPGLIKLGSRGAVSLIDDGILRPLAGATLHHVEGSELELRSSGEGTGYSFVDAANQFTGPTTTFLNEGLLTKTGTGTFTIGVPTFQNRGTIDVRTGKLVVVSPFGQTGAISQDAVLRVAAGATVEFQQQASSSFTFGRLARVEGEGLASFAAPVAFLGSYEFAGETRLTQTAVFRGRVRTTGPWMSRGSCEFTGLSVEFTGAVEFNGGNVVFNQATDAFLPEVRVTRDTTLGGTRGATFTRPLSLDTASLTVQGPVRFAAPVLLKKNLAAHDARGSVTFASLEPTVWEGGDVNLTSGSSRILPGAVFEARSGGTFSALGFRNEGTFRKTTDSTLTLSLPRPPAGVVSFENTGLFEMVDGTFAANTEPGSFQNGGTARFAGGRLVLRRDYVQVGGETVFAGGTLATPAIVNIQGGVVRGQGTVAGGGLTLANTAVLDPGAPVGVLVITNRLGDQDLGPGGLTLGRNSRLVVDLGGRAAGVEYDQIQATGDAGLNGTLEVRLANGFSPNLGDEFTVITARTRRTTKFATETLPVLGAGKKFEVVYETAAVKLRVIAGP